MGLATFIPLSLCLPACRSVCLHLNACVHLVARPFLQTISRNHANVLQHLHDRTQVHHSLDAFSSAVLLVDLRSVVETEHTSA